MMGKIGVDRSGELKITEEENDLDNCNRKKTKTKVLMRFPVRFSGFWQSPGNVVFGCVIGEKLSTSFKIFEKKTRQPTCELFLFSQDLVKFSFMSSYYHYLANKDLHYATVYLIEVWERHLLLSVDPSRPVASISNAP